MDFLRTILLVPLVVIAGLATIMVAGADASQPINVGMVAILAVALLAIAYLFVWHAVGSFLALLAGAGALYVGLAIAALLGGLGGGDPILLQLAVVLPGAVTVLLASIDLLVLFARSPDI